jgi:hypothetical protein
MVVHDKYAVHKTANLVWDLETTAASTRGMAMAWRFVLRRPSLR